MMTPADDIDRQPASDETEADRGGKTSDGRRVIGPESEVRGGSEAPNKTLDEATPVGGRDDPATAERDKT
jgi:hypothetical protein